MSDLADADAENEKQTKIMLEEMIATYEAKRLELETEIEEAQKQRDELQSKIGELESNIESAIQQRDEVETKLESLLQLIPTPPPPPPQSFVDWTKFETKMTLSGHTNSVWCVAVLNESTIVSGSADKSLRIWDAESGETKKTLTGHSNWVSCVAVLNESTIVSGSDDNSLRIWGCE